MTHEKSITVGKKGDFKNLDNSGKNKGSVLTGPKGKTSYKTLKGAVGAAKARSKAHSDNTKAAKRRAKGAGDKVVRR